MALWQDARPSVLSCLRLPRALGSLSSATLHKRDPDLARRLEQVKFTADLAQLSEKELALLEAIAADDQNEFNPAPFVQQSHYQYFKRLAEAGLLIRTGRGRYRLYHTLFREFLRQTK